MLTRHVCNELFVLCELFTLSQAWKVRDWAVFSISMLLLLVAILNVHGWIATKD
jgi:hypothetical protein